MSPVQTGAPPVEETPSPTRSLNWRAIAAPVLRNKSAMVAVGILAFFVFLAIFGPLADRGRPEGEGRGRLRAAEPRVLARHGRRRREHARPAHRRREGLAAHRVLRRGDLGGHRRHGRDPLRLLRREDGHRAHADDRLLPGDPRRPADHRDRRALRPQHLEHHRDHRDHLLDVHRAPPARADEERPRAGLRAARAGARRRQLAPRRAPRPAAGDAAPRREHGSPDRLCDLRRDLHHLPRARRPDHDLVGKPDRERVQGRRDHQRGLVGGAPAGHLRDARRPRLHDHRADDGGRAQPASPHRPPLRPPLPRPAPVRAAERSREPS